ncbi:MAG: DUF4338 domain-containing protein [Bacillus subtilis]|nr:DUF4338 domain-containing protein [Bacillus subtilis]
MNDELRVQGRALGPEHLTQVRQLIAAHPHASRRQLSQLLCEQWDWKNDAGQFKDMAARTLMLKLQQRGFITLPPRRQTPATHRRGQTAPCDLPLEFAPPPPQCGDLKSVQPLSIHCLSAHEPDQRRFTAWLRAHHYLGLRTTVGENLKYLVRAADGQPLACLLFGAAAWQAATRDAWIGWAPAQRVARLQWITNNTRFLILPGVRIPHLASHVLGRVARRIARDWQAKYGHPVVALETFVQRDCFTGACYRAANWMHLGATTGRSRQDRDHQLQVGIKDHYFLPLDRHWRARTC